MATILLVADRVNIFRTFKFIIDPSNSNLNGPSSLLVRVCSSTSDIEKLRYPSFGQENRRKEDAGFFFKDLAQKASALCLSTSKDVQGGRRRIREKLNRKKKRKELGTRDGYRQSRRRAEVEPSPRVVATLDTVKRGD